MSDFACWLPVINYCLKIDILFKNFERGAIQGSVLTLSNLLGNARRKPCEHARCLQCHIFSTNIASFWARSKTLKRLKRLKRSKALKPLCKNSKTLKPLFQNSKTLKRSIKTLKRSKTLKYSKRLKPLF